MVQSAMTHSTKISKLAAALALAGWLLPASWPGVAAVFGSEEPRDLSEEPRDLSSLASYEQDEWIWVVDLYESSKDEGSNAVELRPRPEGEKGFDTLEEALDSLDENHVILTVRLDPIPLRSSDRMKEEILDYLAQHYPKALRVASASSGNLHNPALRPLMRGYSEAILATSFVSELAKVLAKYGHRIVDVSFEKFMMRTDRKPPDFSAITWLQLEKLSEEALKERPGPAAGSVD